MAYDFNAEEVFEMAIQIEKNGAAFYRRAAELQAEKVDKDFLEKIARMEDRHKAGFEEMKQRFLILKNHKPYLIRMKNQACI